MRKERLCAQIAGCSHVGVCRLCEISPGRMGLEKDSEDGCTRLHAYTPTNAATNSASAGDSGPAPGVTLPASGRWMLQRELTGWQVFFVRWGNSTDLVGGEMAARSGMEATRFLSVDEAAELLSVSKRT